MSNLLNAVRAFNAAFFLYAHNQVGNVSMMTLTPLTISARDVLSELIGEWLLVNFCCLRLLLLYKESSQIRPS